MAMQAQAVPTAQVIDADISIPTNEEIGNVGYRVLLTCGEKIVQSLSQDPKTLALQFLSARLITRDILEQTNELNETKREKASRLYTTLLGVVEHHPHEYHEFVSILRPDPLNTDLLTELDTRYGKYSGAGTGGLHEGGYSTHRPISDTVSIPGNVAYIVLLRCGDKIVQSFSKDPRMLGRQLCLNRFMNEAILETIKDPHRTTEEKALKLYTVIQYVVKDHPDKYDTFVSILRQNPQLYTDLLTELDTVYKSIASNIV